MRKDPNKAGEYQTAIQFNLRKTFLNFAQKIQLYLTSVIVFLKNETTGQFLTALKRMA